MKKRGFTIIELLAVIVVLAIIALIATPIVMNVIKNAKIGAVERSADNYVKAVETLIATKKMSGILLGDGNYIIDSTGKLNKDGESYKVDMNGLLPISGTIHITNGQVDKDSSILNYEDYTVTFVDGKAESNEQKNAAILCVSSVPVEQPLLNLTTNENTPTVVGVQATEESPYTPGSTYRCNFGDEDRIFYVLKENESDVQLLMDKNIGTTVAWCLADIRDNTCAADGALSHLQLETKGWVKLFNENGTVSLPAYSDLKSVIGQDWIRGSLAVNNGHSGYWTATSASNSQSALFVRYTGVAYDAYVTGGNQFGVRPMVIVSKENISL